MSEAIIDKIVVTVTVERRLEVDGCDIMQKVLVQDTLVLTEQDSTIDKIREMLKKAEQNPFTFL